MDMRKIGNTDIAIAPLALGGNVFGWSADEAASFAVLDAFVAEANKSADQLKDFYAGISVALEAMLVSPNVLFIAEGTEPDPARPGHQRLDAFSLATRMSLFLWDAVPDDNAKIEQGCLMQAFS